MTFFVVTAKTFEAPEAEIRYRGDMRPRTSSLHLIQVYDGSHIWDIGAMGLPPG